MKNPSGFKTARILFLLCFFSLSINTEMIFLLVVFDFIDLITAEIEDIPSIISETLNFSFSFCIKISNSIIIVNTHT